MASKKSRACGDHLSKGNGKKKQGQIHGRRCVQLCYLVSSSARLCARVCMASVGMFVHVCVHVCFSECFSLSLVIAAPLTRLFRPRVCVCVCTRVRVRVSVCVGAFVCLPSTLYPSLRSEIRRVRELQGLASQTGQKETTYLSIKRS